MPCKAKRQKITREDAEGKLRLQLFEGATERLRADDPHPKRHSPRPDLDPFPQTSFEAKKWLEEVNFPSRGKVNIFPSRGVKVPFFFYQTLHFLRRPSIPREGESYSQGKSIPQRKKFFPLRGNFPLPLEGRLCPKRCLGFLTRFRSCKGLAGSQDFDLNLT